VILLTIQADPKEGFIFKSKLKEVNFFLAVELAASGLIVAVLQGQKKFSGQLATKFG
jgi:hypothetical protein